MLSSAAEHMTHGSDGFHEISLTRFVCPPCINNNSGGPSSASSGVCSFPILDKSQIITLLSLPALAKIGSSSGHHATVVTSSLCPSNECNLSFKLRKSHNATVLSDEAVRKTNSAEGLKEMELMGWEWPLTLWAGWEVEVERMSWIWMVRSSETEAKRESWRGWKETSLTTAS